ncbi:MAG: hydantoinase B/oxoprolinase family protein [Rhodospirillaceae bacterium]|nr:hydantoinase B/oxoprolinase family protein [Rhodospirillaceae bacterium]MBT6137378.1 hydantoinase B/oxoprolinase family protein [Rhodospirillaceae bacterium]
MNAPNPDPITVEIILNALQSVTDESFVALMKSAYSTNIKERHDHSTAIVDKRGRLVVQAANAIPVHVASVLGQMEALLAKYPLEEIHEGDVFIANDPHEGGGTHLPDVAFAMPVFIDGALLGFVCNLAHHADIGGANPGSMSGGMTEIFQEGLRIPVIKLYRKGELQSDMFELILLNVRVREERKGDYNAQLAALHYAERRLRAIAVKHPPAMLDAVFDQIIHRTEGRMRDAVRTIPDGTYTFKDVMDDDGVETLLVEINLTVTIAGDQAKFDFAGTAPQTPGNINIPLHGTKAAVCYAMKAMLDSEIPNNQGVLDTIEVTAPPGTMLSCVSPAAVASRAHTSQRIIDVVIGAMADALPDKVIGAANGANSMAVFTGTHPETGEDYVYLETLGGGMGGRNDRDGKDGVQVHITNTSNLPVEAIEMEYPLLVESYGLIPDTGGAGKYRGGLGLRRVVRPLGHTCLFNGVGERFRTQPWGIFGAHEGASGSFHLETDAGDRRQLEHKTGNMWLHADERVIVDTPGAGGYGDPAERDEAGLEEDVGSGKFSAGYMAKHYGKVAPGE